MTDVSPDEDGEPGTAAVVRQLVVRAGRSSRRVDPAAPTLALVARPQPGERLRYVLEERIVELETRLRSSDGAAEAHEREVRSLQLELSLRAAYVVHLETAQGALHQQLAQQAADRAGLLAELARLRAEVATLGTSLDLVRRRRIYRLADRLARVLRPLTLPLRLARRTLRSRR